MKTVYVIVTKYYDEEETGGEVDFGATDSYTTLKEAQHRMNELGTQTRRHLKERGEDFTYSYGEGYYIIQSKDMFDPAYEFEWHIAELTLKGVEEKPHRRRNKYNKRIRK